MAHVFDHVTIRVSDLEASRRFYGRALGQLGFGEPYSSELGSEWEDFAISPVRAEHPLTRNLHVAFVVGQPGPHPHGVRERLGDRGRRHPLGR